MTQAALYRPFSGLRGSEVSLPRARYSLLSLVWRTKAGVASVDEMRGEREYCLGDGYERLPRLYSNAPVKTSQGLDIWHHRLVVSSTLRIACISSKRVELAVFLRIARDVR